MLHLGFGTFAGGMLQGHYSAQQKQPSLVNTKSVALAGNRDLAMPKLQLPFYGATDSKYPITMTGEIL